MKLTVLSAKRTATNQTSLGRYLLRFGLMDGIARSRDTRSMRNLDSYAV
jgi:hypothetical protein